MLMQVALAGTSYSFLQRMGAIVVSDEVLVYSSITTFDYELDKSECLSFSLQRNGAKLFVVGTSASLVSRLSPDAKFFICLIMLN